MTAQQVFIIGEPELIRVPKLNALSSQVAAGSSSGGFALDLDCGDASAAAPFALDLSCGDASGVPSPGLDIDGGSA